MELQGEELLLTSSDEFKLKAVRDVLEGRLVKRNVPLKALTFETIEQALGGTVRQKVTLQKGIPTEKAREIVKVIKGTKLKVQAAIQGDQLRVTRQEQGRPAGRDAGAEGHGPGHRHAVHELQVARGRGEPSRAGRAFSGLKDIVRLVEDDLGRVEEIFQHAGALRRARCVGEIGRYVQEGGGKRVRPALLLLACRLCGYRGERAVTLASTVEFIHTASLLHDDIIDEATTRRGRRSVNSRWGNDITVLLGDFLYTKSMAMALSQDNLRILRLLSDVTLRLIEGEILEIERNGNLARDARTSTSTRSGARRPTSSPPARASARSWATWARSARRALASYGLNLGLCFQMVDDLLDFTAEEKTLGKPVANDLREGKVTLPMIFLLRRGGTAAAEKVKAVLEDRALLARDARRARAPGARVRRARRGARAWPSATPTRRARDLLAFEPLALPGGPRGAARLHPRPRPLSPGGPPPMTTREKAEKRIARLREEIRRHEHLYYVLDRARDLRPGVRRARARAARARGRVPRPRHPRQPHPARGRDGPRRSSRPSPTACRC